MHKEKTGKEFWKWKFFRTFWVPTIISIILAFFCHRCSVSIWKYFVDFIFCGLFLLFSLQFLYLLHFCYCFLSLWCNVSWIWIGDLKKNSTNLLTGFELFQSPYKRKHLLRGCTGLKQLVTIFKFKVIPFPEEALETKRGIFKRTQIWVFPLIEEITNRCFLLVTVSVRKICFS